MRKARQLLLLLLAAVIAIGMTACAGTAAGQRESEPPVSTGEITEVPVDQQALYEELFLRGSEIIIDVTISDEQLSAMSSDYISYTSTGAKPQTYRIADSVTITVNGDPYEYEQVGIRVKGNTSRRDFYSPSSGLYALQHYRLSFTETFDDEEEYGEEAQVWQSRTERTKRKSRTFATLKQMELKWNNCYDPSYVTEIYSMDMFREFGAMSQRATLCVFRINGECCGVYKLYEPVDEVFLRRYLGDENDNGDLYKCHWGLGVMGGNSYGACFTSNMTYGVEPDNSWSPNHCDLKTNEKSSDNSDMRNLLEVINSPDVTKEQFEGVVDVENFISYAAVSYVVGSPDDLRNNGNNTYVYFRPNDGKAVFITYDNDHVQCIGWDPTGDQMLGFSPYSIFACGDYTIQDNPLFLLTVCAGGWYTQEYRELLLEIAESKWLEPQLITWYCKTYMNTYADYVQPADRYRDSVWADGLLFAQPDENGYIAASEYLTQKRAALLYMIDEYTAEHRDEEIALSFEYED